MFERYLILLSMILAGWLTTIPFSKSSKQLNAIQFLEQCQTSDPESRLACSLKMNLRTATRFDLELIDGVSDTLAFRIYDRRADIMARAKSLAASERHKAFEIVHGIGSKTARKLEQLIELSDYPNLSDSL